MVNARASFSAKRVGDGANSTVADGSGGEGKVKPPTIPRRGKARVAAPAPSAVVAGLAPVVEGEPGRGDDGSDGGHPTRRDSFDF